MGDMHWADAYDSTGIMHSIRSEEIRATLRTQQRPIPGVQDGMMHSALTGTLVPATHENQMPFGRSRGLPGVGYDNDGASHRSYDETRNVMEHMQGGGGGDLRYVLGGGKKEVHSFVGRTQHDQVTGTPDMAEFLQSRQVVGSGRQGTLPFVQEQVGPGFTREMHEEYMARKQMYEEDGALSSRGPPTREGGGIARERQLDDRLVKGISSTQQRRPMDWEMATDQRDRDAVTGPSHMGLLQHRPPLPGSHQGVYPDDAWTTGETRPLDRGRDNRGRAGRTYLAPADPVPGGMMGEPRLGEVRAADQGRRRQLHGRVLGVVGGLSGTGAAGSEDRSGYERTRRATLRETYVPGNPRPTGNVVDLMKSVLAPITEALRPTRKFVSSDRSFGAFGGQAPQRPTVRSGGAGPRVTMKETLVERARHLGFAMGPLCTSVVMAEPHRPTGRETLPAGGALLNAKGMAGPTVGTTDPLRTTTKETTEGRTSVGYFGGGLQGQDTGERLDRIERFASAAGVTDRGGEERLRFGRPDVMGGSYSDMGWKDGAPRTGGHEQSGYVGGAKGGVTAGTSRQSVMGQDAQVGMGWREETLDVGDAHPPGPRGPDRSPGPDSYGSWEAREDAVLQEAPPDASNNRRVVAEVGQGPDALRDSRLREPLEPEYRFQPFMLTQLQDNPYATSILTQFEGGDCC
jgi:hypothetical protein